MLLQFSLLGELSQALLARGHVGPARRRIGSPVCTALVVLLLTSCHVAWALSLPPSTVRGWNAGGRSQTKHGALNQMTGGDPGTTPGTAAYHSSTPALQKDSILLTAVHRSSIPAFRRNSILITAVHRLSTAASHSDSVPNSAAYRLSSPAVQGDPVPSRVPSGVPALGAGRAGSAPAIRLMWDVQFAWGSIYTARVTAHGLGLEHSLCPLKFSWTWPQEEVIWSTRDAHAEDGGDCSRIAHDKYMDESSVASCARRPTVWGGRRKKHAGGSVASFYMVIGNAKWGSWKLFPPGQPSIGLSGYTCSRFRFTSPSPLSAPGRERSAEALASFESLCIKAGSGPVRSSRC